MKVDISVILYNANSWVHPKPTKSRTGGPGEDCALLTSTPSDNSSWRKYFSQEINWPLWFWVAFC